jgi:phosphoribosylanthranilate isomerase
MLPEVKICGITSEVDANIALSHGANYLGFILYEKSPRFVDIEQSEILIKKYKDLTSELVAVDVCPDFDKIISMKKSGFRYFQFHFPLDIDPNIIKEWSTIVGSSNLWLAPKLPPDTEFPETLLNFSDTFLLDAYSKTKFGGTGHSSDWKTFSKCKVSYPEKKWILAGGIGPKNVAEALLQTKADIIDLNSGVEQAPGQKDPLKIKSVFSILSL